MSRTRLATRYGEENDLHQPALDLETLESRALLSIASPILTPPAPSIASGGIILPAPTPAPIVGVGVSIKATAGQAFAGDVGLLKIMKATTNLDLTRLKASINWGDGTPPTDGLFKIDAAGVIHIQGKHTWASPGAYAVLVKVTLPSPTATTPPLALLIRSQAVVAPAMIVIHPIAGQPFAGVVGTFKMPPLMTPISGSPVAYTLAASIDWGDGGRSPGKIVANPAGGYDVFGDHTYAKAGTYKIHIVVTMGPPPTSPPMAFPTRIIAQIDSLAIVLDPTATGAPGTTA